MLDTNIILDWLLGRDALRTEVASKLIAQTPVLHVPDMVVMELVFTLEKYYFLTRQEVAGNIQRVINQPTINCNRALLRQVIGDYPSLPALSFVDCCLLQYAQLQGALPLWTFDKKLVNQSAGVAKLPM